MARLADDAVAAGGVDRAQDGADVVRILNLIQHDDQRRAFRAGDQILDAQVHGVMRRRDTP
jgi:hypothetical protein